ncbi:MAG: hypothetical protein KKD17_05280 [Nanoarchaeota archaeon]|nr:hypothetical protein [Nanoarchaeota archaeon]
MKKEVVKANSKSDILERFRTLEYHSQLLFTILISVGVISLWRGMWLLMDLFFFPGQELISGVFSMLLGLTILAATGTMIKVLR